MIEFKNVKLDYEDVSVFSNLNFKIKESEFITVLGLNGSGKTSLFKLMNGLLLPTAGEVLVDGMNTKDEQKIWEIRRDVGVVFQNPENQIVGTTVEEDVAFGLENLGVPRAEMVKKIEEVLKFVGLYDLKNVEPHRLSGGQKQLLCVADILVMGPKYIVMDEPTSMMDPVSREVIFEILSKLHQNGHTIIFSTHLLDEIVNAERILYLKNGNLLFDGKTVDVINEIKDDFGSSELIDFEIKLYRSGVIKEFMSISKLERRLIEYCQSNLKR